MEQNTSIYLGNYFDNFVRANILEGRYRNASEVVCTGLRLLEEEENKVKVLKNFLQEGIDTGIAANFNPEEHLELLKAKKRND